MIIATPLDKQFDDPFKLIIMKLVDVWRARLIRNSLEKAPQDRKFFRQTLYMRTKVVDETICNLTGCEIVETIDALPMSIRANNMMYDFVGAVNSTTAYQQVYSGTLEYVLQEEYNKAPLFMVENGKLRIYRAKPPVIKVETIFPDPQLVARMSCANGVNCDYWNSNYPVPEDILQTIIQGIREVDFKGGVVPADIEIPVVNNPANAQ